MAKHLLLFYLLSYTVTNAQYLHDSLKVDEGYIHYYVKGKGQPIVLLQGGSGFSHYYMRAIADSLTAYKNILIDYQGTGRSQYKKADTTWVNPDNIVSDVELVRKKLRIDKWIIIGQSYGTHFALNYAIKYPQHTSRIILLNSAGTNTKFLQYYGDNIRYRLTEGDKLALKTLSNDSSSTQLDRFRVLLNGYFYDRTKSSSFLDSVTKEEMPFFYNSEFFQAYVQRPDFMTFDISKEVYNLDQPIRIIQGRQDPVNSGIQERLNMQLSDSKIFYIERSGHFPWLEQPNDFFARLKKCLND
jgi:proline iminopeptidase